jgi:hypothetical protein
MGKLQEKYFYRRISDGELVVRSCQPKADEPLAQEFVDTDHRPQTTNPELRTTVRDVLPVVRGLLTVDHGLLSICYFVTISFRVNVRVPAVSLQK